MLLYSKSEALDDKGRVAISTHLSRVLSTRRLHTATCQAWVEWLQALIYNRILRFDVQDASSTNKSLKHSTSKDVPLQLKL